MKLDDINNPIKIFLDMDGVVADLLAAISRRLDKPVNSISSDEIYDFLRETAKAKIPIFLEIPKMKDADKLYNYVKKYNHQFLTSAGSYATSYIAKQKIEWVRKHFGNVKVDVVSTSKEKAAWAKPYHILIDDRDKSINAWVAAGGIGILHKNARSTISQLTKMGI